MLVALLTTKKDGWFLDLLAVADRDEIASTRDDMGCDATGLGKRDLALAAVA
jgi:hypothetical protein